MDAVQIIKDALQGVALGDQQRRVIDMSLSEIALLDRKVSRLEAENATLNKSLAEAQRQLAVIGATTNLVNFRGVLWKRQADGTFEDLPYCPRCRKVLSLFGPLPVHCDAACGFTGPLQGEHAVRQAHQEVTAKHQPIT